MPEPKPSRRLDAVPIVVAALLVGCVGHIGDGEDGTTPATGEHASPLCEGAPSSVGVTPMRRMTIREFDNTIRDLLGDDTKPAAHGGFPPDEAGTGFASNISSPVSAVAVESFRAVAEGVAERALDRLDTILPCSPADGEDACIETFVTQFGRLAYRRPLTAGEVDAYVALYATVRKGSADAPPGSFEDGVRVVIATALQSPSFLYRVELPTGTAKPKPLGPYEMATRLAVFLWESTPDEELLDAAAAGELDTKDGIEVEALRMLDDARAADAIGDFHVQWLGLTDLPNVDVDSDVYPDFAAVREDLVAETALFASYVVREEDGRLATLLTSPIGFVNSATASLYGAADPGSGAAFVRADLDPTRRSGLLTQPSLLAVTGRYSRTSPTVRGKFLYERVLCGPAIPPPPANVPKFEPKPGLSKKELSEEHRKNGCASCHVAMDPLGFTLEHYDIVGRWRTVDEFGEKVDATADLVSTDVDGPVDGAVELGARLAGSSQVRACASKQWLRFAIGRTESEPDSCSAAALGQAFEDSGGDVRALVLSIVTSDTFRLRADAP